MQLTIAQCQGVKIGGRRPKLDDFLPEFAKHKPKKTDPDEREKKIKAMFMSIATKPKPKP